MMKHLIYILTLIIAFCYTLSAEDDFSDLAEIEIISSHQQIASNSEFTVAVKFTLKEDWHIYWQNPGDSGIPTEIEWGLPEGVEAVGELQWPVPLKIVWSDMITYGYEGEILLLQKFKANIIDKNKIEISATANWLICKEKCIPQDGDSKISLAVGKEMIESNNKALIEKYLQKVPERINSDKFKVNLGEEYITVNGEGVEDVNEISFYPITQGVIDNTVKPTIKNNRKGFEAKFKTSPYLFEQPNVFAFVLIQNSKQGKQKFLETKVIINK